MAEGLRWRYKVPFSGQIQMLYPTYFLSHPDYRPGFLPTNSRHLGSFEISGERNPANEDNLMLCFRTLGKRHRPKKVDGELSLDGSEAEVLLGSSGKIKSLSLIDYFFIPGEREVPFRFGLILLRYDGSMLDVFLKI